MTRFAILLAGPLAPTPALKAAVPGSRVIAADGGIAHADALGVRPELWLGDFDSAPETLTHASVFSDIPRQTHPRDKDRTDGELAIEAAKARGGHDLLLVGALGGRSDHAFSHLVIALREAAQGLRIELVDGRERAVPLLPGHQIVEAEPGAQVSILKFTDLKGLTLRGVRFPLDRADIPFHSILTQSNEATGPVEIELRAGQAIALVQTDPHRR